MSYCFLVLVQFGQDCAKIEVSTCNIDRFSILISQFELKGILQVVEGNIRFLSFLVVTPQIVESERKKLSLFAIFKFLVVIKDNCFCVLEQSVGFVKVTTADVSHCKSITVETQFIDLVIVNKQIDLLDQID